MSAAIRAGRAALEMIGAIFVLSVFAGALKLRLTEWDIFLSGGLWIALPAVAAALAYRNQS
jgi:hypothetical protein